MGPFYSFAAKVSTRRSLVGEVIQEYVKGWEPGGALLVFPNDSRWWVLSEVWGFRGDVGLVGTGRTCSRNGDRSRVGLGWEVEEGTWWRRNGMSKGMERGMTKDNVEDSLAWVKNSCERTGERSLERQVRIGCEKFWMPDLGAYSGENMGFGIIHTWVCSFIHSFIQWDIYGNARYCSTAGSTTWNKNRNSSYPFRAYTLMDSSVSIVIYCLDKLNLDFPCLSSSSVK